MGQNQSQPQNGRLQVDGASEIPDTGFLTLDKVQSYALQTTSLGTVYDDDRMSMRSGLSRMSRMSAASVFTTTGVIMEEPGEPSPSSVHRSATGTMLTPQDHIPSPNRSSSCDESKLAAHGGPTPGPTPAPTPTMPPGTPQDMASTPTRATADMAAQRLTTAEQRSSATRAPAPEITHASTNASPQLTPRTAAESAGLAQLPSNPNLLPAATMTSSNQPANNTEGASITSLQSTPASTQTAARSASRTASSLMPAFTLAAGLADAETPFVALPSVDTTPFPASRRLTPPPGADSPPGSAFASVAGSPDSDTCVSAAGSPDSGNTPQHALPYDATDTPMGTPTTRGDVNARLDISLGVWTRPEGLAPPSPVPDSPAEAPTVSPTEAPAAHQLPSSANGSSTLPVSPSGTESDISAITSAGNSGMEDAVHAQVRLPGSYPALGKAGTGLLAPPSSTSLPLDPVIPTTDTVPPGRDQSGILQAPTALTPAAKAEQHEGAPRGPLAAAAKAAATSSSRGSQTRGFFGRSQSAGAVAGARGVSGGMPGGLKPQNSPLMCGCLPWSGSARG